MSATTVPQPPPRVQHGEESENIAASPLIHVIVRFVQQTNKQKLTGKKTNKQREMARHRSVRGYNYDEDFEEDDLYGQSVEDDYGVSPATAAQFMYQRADFQLANFVDEPLKEEDEECEEQPPANSNTLSLSDIDKARLHSCLEEMRNIAGDAFPEPVMVQAVLNSNFEMEKALDSLFLQSDKTRPEVKEQRLPRSSRGKRGEASSVSKAESDIVPKVAKMTISGKQTIGFDASIGSPNGQISNTSNKESHSESVQSTSSAAMCTKQTLLSEGPTLVSNQKLSPKPPAKMGLHTEDTPTGTVTSGKQAGKNRAKLDVKSELEKRQGGKQLINLVVIGHVDAGKSTLMGHLLYLLGNVNKRAMHKYEQESKKAGKASFAYAWVLDETGEERERGVTMDVGLTKFESKTKLVTLMDAPGHKDFIPNMITGAAQADVALLVVDSITGEFEAGFEAGGQTREHALLVRSLGVTQLAVAINKMDMLNWSKERFEEITSKLGQFLKQAGFKESDVTYIPTSGLSGENLAMRSKDEKLTSWYSGPCLLDCIDSFRPPQRPVDKPCRLCVSDVFKDVGAGFSVAGKVEAGYVQTGDRLVVMPANEMCTVKGITLHDEPMDWAAAGDHVTLNVTGMDMIKVGVGSVVCDPKEPIRASTRVRARILIFNIDLPITRGFPVLLHYQTVSEPAVIKKLISVLHKSTGEVVKTKPRCLQKGQNAMVELQMQRPVCLERYKDFRELGRFMLRYSGSTIAAGVVTEIKD
ncbi:HBS1-like protein isoform X2 [Petromyzon marinus]|uniref:HBS1-like protein isoform X2 n=1 Tax=Petromyzon marinus TaxID=7757 RepID=UPI003F6EA429